MENGYTNLMNTAQFGFDLVEYYKNTNDEWLRDSATLSLLAIEDILDRGRHYCSDPDQILEINIMMDKIREEIGVIRDADPESFREKVTRNCERLKSQF
jgi:hypothetical protein